jgi:hypothetical protein
MYGFEGEVEGVTPQSTPTGLSGQPRHRGSLKAIEGIAQETYTAESC